MRVRKCLSQHTQRASVISRPTARQTVKAKLSVKVRGRKTTKQKLKLMYYQTRCDHHHHQVQLLCVVQRLYIVQLECRKKLNWHSITQWRKRGEKEADLGPSVAKIICSTISQSVQHKRLKWEREETKTKRSVLIVTIYRAELTWPQAQPPPSPPPSPSSQSAIHR